MSTLTLYGIPNCNQVKSARDWIEQHGIDYVFHDYKKQGVPLERLSEWVQQSGLEKIVNRKGTTWRMLDDAQRQQCDTLQGAIKIMQNNASLIKRPILENTARQLLCVGFDPNEYTQQFK